MKKNVFRCVLPALALCLSFVWTGESAAAATLHEIRTGGKSGFTRLVFQFDALPLLKINDKAAPNELSLTFLEADAGLLPAPKNPYDAPVETITVHQDGPHLTAVVVLSTPDYRLKTFTLTEPYRVVLDLYPAAVGESLVLLNKLVIKESAVGTPPADAKAPKVEPATPAAVDPQPAATPTVEAATPATSEAAAVALEPEETAEAPEPPVPAEPEPDDSRQATAAQAQTRDVSVEKETPPADNPTPSVLGKFQRNLIIVLAGISIVILALIGFLLMQKRNNAARNRPVESVRELKTTADIMASIDARIKEKFKQYEQANPD